MKLTKYIITKFVPKEIEKEHIPCKKFNGGKDEILYRPREPSEFIGKTIALETSGILFDRDDIKRMIEEIYKSRTNASSDWMDFAKEIDKMLNETII